MKNEPLRQRVAHNSIIVALGEWTHRLIGVASMIILARLLMPEDFGIATATVAAIIFLRALTYIGLRQYLIQKDTLEQADLNTAWTTQLIYSALAPIILFVFSQEISILFNEPRIAAPLQVLAFIPLIDAFKSIGLAVKSRELDFIPETKLGVAGKLLAFPITVGATIILKNYWALIIGEVATVLITVIYSYKLAPHKVAPSLTGYVKQWHFVKWMYVQGILNLTREKIDALLVTRYLGVTAGGQYAMSLRLSDLAVNNFMRPMGSTLFSAFAMIKNDDRALQKSTLEMLAILLFVTLPIFIWITVASTPLVTLLLGSEWLHITPVLPTITAMFCLMQVMGLLNNILILKNRQKTSVTISTVTISMFVASVLYVSKDIHIEQFALLRALTIAVSVIALAVVTTRLLNIKWTSLISSLLLPILAATTSLLISLPIFDTSKDIFLSPFWQLALSMFLVVSIYLCPFYFAQYILNKPGHELNFLHNLLIPYARKALYRVSHSIRQIK